MSAKYPLMWAAFGVLWCVAGAGAQTTAAASIQTKNIDPTLLAKAKAGDPDAENRLGYSYAKLGNLEESHRWQLRAAEGGNVTAMTIVAADFELGRSVQQNYALAFWWYRKAADKGSLLAITNVGSMYDSGEGVQQDFKEAAAWYLKAANGGDQNAQYDLGVLYQEGTGAPQIYAQAAFWFSKAAEQGYAYAQYALGASYRDGHGVPHDYAQAAVWFSKAAAQGNANAQKGLGDLYYQGGNWMAVDGPEGGKKVIRDDSGGAFPQDYAQAAYWYRKAAEQGDADAQNSLGLLYDSGTGVPKDSAEAYFWYSIAAAKNPLYSSNRDTTASDLTKTVLLQTQERARKWFEDHSAKPQ